MSDTDWLATTCYYCGHKATEHDVDDQGLCKALGCGCSTFVPDGVTDDHEGYNKGEKIPDSPMEVHDE